MTAHLAHAGLAKTVGLSIALFVLAVAVVSAVAMGGGASGRLLAGLLRHCWRSWLAHRAAHRPAHRARRPHPRMASVALAAHLTLTRHTHGGTR